MRSSIFWAAALVLLAAMVSACGGDSDDTSTETTDAQVSATAEAAANVTGLPAQFTGTGSGATGLFELKKGIPAKFSITHDGVEEFIAFLKDEDGNPLGTGASSALAGGFLAPVIGVFEGTKTVDLLFTRLYFVEVTADGNWTIDVEQ